MKKLIFVLILAMIFPFSMFSCDDFIGSDSSSSQETESETSSADASIEELPTSEGVTSDTPVMSDKLPTDSSAPTPEPEGSISVVVLGDSIARGYGLANIDEQRFSSLLAEDLKTIYADVSVVNYGIDGQTGFELLDSLQTDPPAELQDCDSVIISIGGNNILQALTTLASSFSDIGEVDPAVFKDYFLYLFAKDEQTKQKYAYSCETINGIFKAVNDAFEGDEFNSLINKAEQDLTNEIPLIVSEIKKLNPDADIYIQTVYNPYKNVDISLEGIEQKLDLSLYGERAVSKLNAPIVSLAEDNGYTVVPVWEHFDRSKKTLTNAGFDIANTRFSVDPHPNYYGHMIIAEIYYKMLTEGKNG